MTCKDCTERVTNCGPKSYAMCVRYQGKLIENSNLKDFCEVSVQDTIEELYDMIVSTGTIYYNGEGIKLDHNTFSVDFNKVMPSDWRPEWNDIQGDFPYKVNIEGEGVEGTFPSYIIKNVGIKELRVEDILIPNNVGVVNIQKASYNDFGVIKLGSNMTLDQSGRLKYNISGLHGVSVNNDQVKLNTTSEVIQINAPNNVTTTENRTYSIQIDTDGNTVVNVPWINYTEGVGININNGIISNTSPNATHSGDVSGSDVLTIGNNKVTNEKLKKAPPATVKCNISSTEQNIQDVSIPIFKDFMELGCKHIIIDTYPGEISVGNNHQTSVFCLLPDIDTLYVDVEDGNFDGQQLYLEFNYYTSETVKVQLNLNGNFIDFKGASPTNVVTQLRQVNISDHFLFWSVDNNAWMTRI